MKEVTIDGKEYLLVPSEKLTCHYGKLNCAFFSHQCKTQCGDGTAVEFARMLIRPDQKLEYLAERLTT